MVRLSQLPMGVGLSLLAAVNVAAVPSVTVDMKAAFPSGPYLLELLETAAGENATAYFPLLDRIASGHFSEAKTDKEIYDKFLLTLNEDGHITTPDALSTFKLALSLRTAAPRIEAHYQYYRTAVEPKVDTDTQDSCEVWAEQGGKQYCSPSLDAAKDSTLDGAKVLPFDRVLGSGKEAILYADPTSPSFGSFHIALAQKARNGELEYRLRYTKPAGKYEEPLPVSGYGVELALKRTDYIVIDDREAHQDDSQKTVKTKKVLDAAEEVADLKPLSKSKVQELGLKAASFVMQSQNPFETLLKLSQDFPKFSTSIAAHNVSAEFLAEHQLNRQQLVPSGMNVLWMNGVQLIERQIEAFTIIDLLRRERKLIDGVRDLGFTGGQAVSLLGHPKVAESKSDEEPPRFDWTDDLEEEQVIMFLNDLEKDERYQDFPDQLTSLLQRVYPGQLPPIKRDIFNLIIPVDFSKMEDLSVVAQMNSFVQRKLPIRFGLVPLTPTEDAFQISKILYYLLDNYGLDGFIEYLDAAMQASKTEKPDQGSFDQAIKDREPLPDSKILSFAEVVQSDELDSIVKLAKNWAKRLNANTPVPPVFINGIPVPREGNWLQAMSMKASSDLQAIQRAVYLGMVDEKAWIPDFFLEKAVKRRNTYIYPEDEKSLQVLDVNKIYTEYDSLFSKVPVIEAYADSTKENWAVLTVVGDFTSDEGTNLLLSALAFRRNNPGVRLDVVHNPSASASASSANTALKNGGDKLAEAETLSDIKDLLSAASGDSDAILTAALNEFLSFAAVKPGSNLLILNGRVVGPFTADDPFQGDDFQFLLEFEQKARILPVYAAVDELGLTDKIAGPLAAAKITSVTALSTISDLPAGIFESAPSLRVSAHDAWNSTYTAIEIGNPETSSIHLVGVLNPASEQAQRWAPILKVVSELEGVYLKLFLNPKDKIDELPVKRFFRYVLESEPTFDEAGKVRALEASFKSLPSEALLNAGMDVPPSWLVAPKVSPFDPDNIKLSSIKSNVHASYELESILIEGHSREGGQSQPPRGAQVVLGTEKEPHFADTLIMANLGYFQFKANPGFYNIKLKEGRSTDIYTIDSIGAKGWAPVPGDEGTEVVLMDFQGTTLYPRLSRKPGQEESDVLAEPEDNSIVGRGLKFAGGILGKKKSASDEEHAEINIFSVASGHLYERMLNIMMVSVMKNTKHTVKFWFIEQFLSPSFKDFIPHMAKEYGFKYEMVTFKWPHWLRQQKEKQREIWGYKILFLDVLFPLSLDKVIFVDADQIVRTDMISLVNHDLEGKPYGFTPMCDSRTEMEGFRFWKQGYWANYLRGQPYHISALYVVDLRRFRELAAGDRLRQTYHSLSADPNSLANLDQDLPNHMQFQIPIHSLPQEWLWCETWCSDESQRVAKTIDLCNNPQTKEPKLDRARRQVPEWTVYDDEIAALDRKRKGLPAETPKKEEKLEVVVGDDGEAKQKPVVVEEVEKNTKSRNWEEPPSEQTHVRDEL